MIVAPTAEEADYLASSSDLGWVRLHRREFLPLPSPEEARRYGIHHRSGSSSR